MVFLYTIKDSHLVNTAEVKTNHGACLVPPLLYTQTTVDCFAGRFSKIAAKMVI